MLAYFGSRTTTGNIYKQPDLSVFLPNINRGQDRICNVKTMYLCLRHFQGVYYAPVRDWIVRKRVGTVCLCKALYIILWLAKRSVLHIQYLARFFRLQFSTSSRVLLTGVPTQTNLCATRRCIEPNICKRLPTVSYKRPETTAESYSIRRSNVVVHLSCSINNLGKITVVRSLC